MQMLNAGKKNWNKLQIYLDTSLVILNCVVKTSEFQEKGKLLSAALGNAEGGLKGKPLFDVEKVIKILV